MIYSHVNVTKWRKDVWRHNVTCLLFLDEHVVVEELLQFLIGEVDAELFEGVQVEDLKTSNVQHTNEALPGHVCVQGLVHTADQPTTQKHTKIRQSSKQLYVKPYNW